MMARMIVEARRTTFHMKVGSALCKFCRVTRAMAVSLWGVLVYVSGGGALCKAQGGGREGRVVKA